MRTGEQGLGWGFGFEILDLQEREQSKICNLKFKISDTGPGIAKDQLPLLFHKFTRLACKERSVTGTGLGLVISRQIVEAHKGQVRLKSEPGKGSTFTVTLPVRNDS